MKPMQKSERRIFECMLILVSVGMTYLVYQMGGYKLVALNLFFLPIVLSGYYLGRTSAGVLALFCSLAVTVATTMDPSGFAAYTSPIMMGLSLTVWAAVLGLTAILVGTLCDERAAKVDELHEAYVGVVEVLAKYLQSGNPKMKTRAVRLAELCQLVAEDLKLSRKQVDDIRVGALLHDLGNVEITTKVLSKAVDTLESTPGAVAKHTFLGADLVHSLGAVLHSAVPLVLNQDDPLHDAHPYDELRGTGETPLGAKIISAVRAFDSLAYCDGGESRGAPAKVLAELRKHKEHDEEVLAALERACRRHSAAPTEVREPAFA